MALIVIVGIKSCKDFAHACYVAELLQKNLPDFNCHIDPQDQNEWANWITDKNAEKGWNHSKSPLVYKELTMRGGKEYYIGGVDEFWEYVCDYYGLEYILPKSKLYKLQKDNIQYFEKEKKESIIENDVDAKDLYRVCICGAELECLSLLLPELIKLESLHGKDGIAIYLYTDMDYSDLLDMEDEPDLHDYSQTYHVYVQAIEVLEEYLHCVDLMIIFGNIILYNPKTEFEEFLYANLEVMSEYAEVINSYGKRSLRIVVAYPPTCYNATILTELLTTVRLKNIVAVTADLGYEALNIVSKSIQVPTSHLSSPPIYGFVDINRLIDIGNIIEKVEYFRPTKRIGNNKVKNTSLKVGDVSTELRPIIYLTHNLKNVWKDLHYKKIKTEYQLGRFSYYSKVRATMDLLKHWYNKPTDAIISAGIITYGRYGITNPIVFSQPVILQKGVWVPCENFPKPQYDIEIEDLVAYPMEIIEKFQTDYNASRVSLRSYHRAISYMKLGSDSYFTNY